MYIIKKNFRMVVAWRYVYGSTHVTTSDIFPGELFAVSMNLSIAAAFEQSSDKLICDFCAEDEKPGDWR